MGFRYRSPSVKIGGVRIRKNKKGFSVSSKTLTGGTKTYNSYTGRTTKTYKTGIKGLSYRSVSGGNTTHRKVATPSRSTKRTNWGLIVGAFFVICLFLKYFYITIPILILGLAAYFYIAKRKKTDNNGLMDSEIEANNTTEEDNYSAEDDTLIAQDNDDKDDQADEVHDEGESSN